MLSNTHPFEIHAKTTILSFLIFFVRGFLIPDDRRENIFYCRLFSNQRLDCGNYVISFLSFVFLTSVVLTGSIKNPENLIFMFIATHAAIDPLIKSQQRS